MIDIKNRELHIKLNDNFVELPKDLRNKMEDYWNNTLIKQMPDLWNGPLLCANKLYEDDNKIELTCCKTDYIHFMYDEKVGCPAEYGSYGLSGGILFQTSDDYYVIGNLADTTSLPDGLTIQGGAVDKEDAKDGKIEIYQTIKREAIEEIGIDIDDRRLITEFRIKYLVPPDDLGKGYEIIAVGRLNMTKDEVDAHYKKYYEYLKNNNLEIELKGLIFFSIENAIEELNKCEKPKRNYLLPLFMKEEEERKNNLWKMQ